MPSKAEALARSSRRRTIPKGSEAQTHAVNLLEEIDHLGQELSAAREPKAVADTLTRRLVDRYGVAASGVWLLSDVERALELAACAGRPALPPSLRRTGLTQSILGRAAQHGLPQVLVRKNGDRDELARWADRHGLSLLAAYPLLQGSSARGVLLVACAKSPGESLLSLFRLHARLGALALHDSAMRASIRRTLNRLSFLVEASKALNSTLDLAELLSRILDVAKAQVEAERGTIFLVDEKKGDIWSLIAHGIEKEEIRLPLGRGIAGHVAQTGEVVNISDAYSDPRFNTEVDRRTGYCTRNILCLPIRNKTGKIIAALELLNKRSGPFLADDADFLLTLSTHIALALENAQLHQALLEKERMEKELALARSIQRSLLPLAAPAIPGFDIAVLNQPCYEVGGDYYDFVTLGPNTLLTIIADVEGKGVSSALVMSNLQATLRALVVHLHSLNEITEALNRAILNDSRGQKFLSIFLGLIDLRHKMIHYINCGHVPPVIVRGADQAIPLRAGGTVIGLFDNARYELGHSILEPGDVLILCTDGVTESMNAQREEYGLERLLEAVRSAARQSAAGIVAFANDDVDRFSHLGTHADDKVMIAIKVM